MIKKTLYSLLFISLGFYHLFVHRCRELPPSIKENGISVIDDIQEIKMSGYKMYNPGVLDLGETYLLVARQKGDSFLNYVKLKLMGKHLNRDTMVIGELDKNFCEVVKIKHIIFPKPHKIHKVMDPRLFMHKDQIYMIFCDNSLGGSIQTLARLEKEEETWKVKKVLPLSFPQASEFYSRHLVEPSIEKNWMPFSKNGKVHIVYLLEPEKIVLEVDLETGYCAIISRTPNELGDQFSPLRGGSPPIYDPDLDEFITLYHVAFPGRQSFTNFEGRVYTCGAYTFTSSLPYKMTAKSAGPLYQEELYANKRKIIFPTALISRGKDYLMFYGEDDCRIKVACIKKDKLISTMKKAPIERY